MAHITDRVFELPLLHAYPGLSSALGWKIDYLTTSEMNHFYKILKKVTPSLPLTVSVLGLFQLAMHLKFFITSTKLICLISSSLGIIQNKIITNTYPATFQLKR